jgi:hypothetical protein
MKRYIAVFITIYFNVMLFSSDILNEISKDDYYNICGVWVFSKSINPDALVNENYSWGISKMYPISSLVIDLNEKQSFMTTDAGVLDILDIKKNDDNSFSLTTMDTHKRETVFILNYDSKNNTIWFNKTNGYFTEGPNKKNPFYKLGGPEKKSFITKVSTLRLRETSGNDGKIIRLLSKGEKLELLEKGKEEIINGIKGNWVKVKTGKGEIGWCFDGYLEEVKK